MAKSAPVAGAKSAKGRLMADSKGHRAAMVEHLFAGMRAALDAGDVEGARVAHEAIGRLLVAASAPSTVAPVVDLATEREKRGGGR